MQAEEEEPEQFLSVKIPLVCSPREFLVLVERERPACPVPEI